MSRKRLMPTPATSTTLGTLIETMTLLLTLWCLASLSIFVPSQAQTLSAGQHSALMTIYDALGALDDRPSISHFQLTCCLPQTVLAPNVHDFHNHKTVKSMRQDHCLASRDKSSFCACLDVVLIEY